jgi:predicted aconitase
MFDMIFELTDLQKRMIDGQMGEPVRQAMELNMELAKFWEAPNLLPVHSGHMVGCGVKTARHAGRKYARWV